jgi:predicted small secreted protein
MERFIRLCVIGAVMVALSGLSMACNTTEGVGKDVEKAGDNLKDAARDAKN